MAAYQQSDEYREFMKKTQEEGTFIYFTGAYKSVLFLLKLVVILMRGCKLGDYFAYFIAGKKSEGLDTLSNLASKPTTVCTRTCWYSCFLHARDAHSLIAFLVINVVPCSRSFNSVF